MWHAEPMPGVELIEALADSYHHVGLDDTIVVTRSNKANYAVLEGFMCSLLNEKFKINRFLDSESNQQTENDKFNRVDILAENEKGEFIIFEIQNTREHTYFHRMLYGVSKVITDNISLGDDYDKVRKVYSINIVYFTLGQAKDYVYHGKTMFQGLHQPNIRPCCRNRRC